ncbi:hypothetical protein QE152_g595 [Popillia japonica]|uniref:Uncharacterized protein n=1 Tax=Popillia japonica TaxID=7064 RepID=A0AAW1NJN5_POPJA
MLKNAPLAVKLDQTSGFNVDEVKTKQNQSFSRKVEAVIIHRIKTLDILVLELMSRKVDQPKIFRILALVLQKLQLKLIYETSAPQVYFQDIQKLQLKLIYETSAPQVSVQDIVDHTTSRIINAATKAEAKIGSSIRDCSDFHRSDVHDNVDEVKNKQDQPFSRKVEAVLINRIKTLEILVLELMSRLVKVNNWLKPFKD